MYNGGREDKCGFETSGIASCTQYDTVILSGHLRQHAPVRHTGGFCRNSRTCRQNFLNLTNRRSDVLGGIALNGSVKCTRELIVYDFRPIAGYDAATTQNTSN